MLGIIWPSFGKLSSQPQLIHRSWRNRHDAFLTPPSPLANGFVLDHHLLVGETFRRLRLGLEGHTSSFRKRVPGCQNREHI